MEEDRHRRLEEDWRRMDDAMRRHEEDGYRRYDDDARRRMDDDRKRFDDAFNAEPAPMEANREILGELEFEAPPGTGDRARTAHDSALFVDAHQETVALAEILNPGIRLPAFNRNAKPAETVGAMFDLRRRALTGAYASGPEMRAAIDVLTSGSPGHFDSGRLPNDQLRVVFKAAAMQKRTLNTAAQQVGRQNIPAATRNRPQTPADLQAQLDQHWAGGRIN
jgi:hypothetical protein